MTPGEPESMLPPDAPRLAGDATRPDVRHGPQPVAPLRSPVYRWHHKAGALVLAVFCMASEFFC